ncbi:transposase [Myxococcota bacterium]
MKKTRKKAKQSLLGRRFTEAERWRALTRVASGMELDEVANTIGTTATSVRKWRRAAIQSGTMPASAAVGRSGSTKKGKPPTVRRKGVASKRRPRQRCVSGRGFTDEQKQHALMLIVSGMERKKVAATIGTTTQSLGEWYRAAVQSETLPTPPVVDKPKDRAAASGQASSFAGTHRKSPYAPADPAHGLSVQEEACILEYKKKHPSMGPAQLRSQLKRFQGWRISIKAIKRVLKQHGYQLVHRGSRPQGEVVERFEAPRRNALWQADFAEVRVGQDRLYVLILLDDFSRYVVGHVLCSSPWSAVAVETLRAAMARHGKPESIRTDRGGALVAFAREGDFGRVAEAEDITHIVGKPYRPKGGGKVESAVGTLRRELWDLEQFEDPAHAEQRLSEFFGDYNERRAHMGIEGLTPADRFHGRADEVLARIDAISRQRQGVRAQGASVGSAIEELCSSRAGSPMEVLRLTLAEGILELRFCGARVVLGKVDG